MLLHELGHLIPGKDKNWLLPNDGGDAILSTRNSRTVENHCEEQISWVVRLTVKAPPTNEKVFKSIEKLKSW